jgi:D-beta-D-heptose 7-phosphate kinase/D-beta-D-heptose 1-phosphate adenosyltransferase
MERVMSESVNVWVNGTFDILHRGHLELFEFASKLGKVRVGIDTDERVKNLKGDNRPINRFQDRKYFLESLTFIDSVVGFSTDQDLINHIENWSPKYFVIGTDYFGKNIIGKDKAQHLIYFEKLNGYSTSKIIHECQKF